MERPDVLVHHRPYKEEPWVHLPFAPEVSLEYAVNNKQGICMLRPYCLSAPLQLNFPYIMEDGAQPHHPLDIFHEFPPYLNGPFYVLSLCSEALRFLLKLLMHALS